MIQMENMAFFFGEGGLTNYSVIIRYCPSMIAACAVYAARCTLSKTPLWTETLKYHTGYYEDQLMYVELFYFYYIFTIFQYTFLAIINAYLLQVKNMCVLNRECSKVLVGFHGGAAENKLRAVYRKYSNPERGGVALYPPARSLLLAP